MIPLNKPYINNSGQLLKIEDFVKTYYPDRFFHTTLSARQGLSEIYRQIKIEKGPQNVAVSPLTCVEALYPIINNGHKIKFIDINPETLNMDEDLIPSNMDIVQVIHLGGNPQDMSKILHSNPLLIVEDCAQCFGSRFNNNLVGLFGDYSSFSFMKNIFSLGGGFVLSKSEIPINHEKYNEFNYISTFYRYLKRNLEKNCISKNNVSYFLLKTILKLKPENTSLILNNSYNSKLIIKSIERQLASYNEIVNGRIENAKYILENIKNKNVEHQKITNSGYSNYLRLFFILKKKTTKEVTQYLRKYGIGANHLTQSFLNPYQPRFDKNIHLKKYIQKNYLPNYFELHDRIISIPVSPALTVKELRFIIDIMNNI